jgi:hypothetical protein
LGLPLILRYRSVNGFGRGRKAGGARLACYLGPMNGSLAFAILYDLFWLGVMGILYWRRIFIRL